MINPTFGRLESKDRSYEVTYAFKKLSFIPTAVKVENSLLLPYSLRNYYNQGNLGACVGFSSSWMMSIYNNNPQQKYDATWLYRKAQVNDNDPTTDPTMDTGTYVWAAFWVLQHLGHKKSIDKVPDIKDGINSYYWCKSSDEIRTAIALGRPVVIGINWYEVFMNPNTVKGEYWIGNKPNLRNSLGGHAICLYGASDKRQAFKLVNTWGTQYPLVWIPYTTMDRLLQEDGEAVVAVDNPTIT